MAPCRSRCGAILGRLCQPFDVDVTAISGAWSAGSVMTRDYIRPVLTNRPAASLDTLADVLPLAWDAQTAWIDDWVETNPARGQCGSTALVLQDLRGGTLITGVVQDGRNTQFVHHWNALPTATADLTWQQFAPGARILTCEAIVRRELLRNSWFINQYHTLRDRVNVLLRARVDHGSGKELVPPGSRSWRARGI